MPKYTTLLPYKGERRTGRLYDNPDGNGNGGQTVIKSSKVIVTDDDRRLIQDKTWTKEGGWKVEVHTARHALVARATSKYEEHAWNKVLEELRLQRYHL
jgi:hypothetical protein